MTLSDKKRSEIWRTDAGVLVVRATGVPRQTHECRAHRLVVHEERAHGLLDGRLIDRGFGGLQGQADTGADHGGGASCARQDGSHIETRSHCPGNSNHLVLDMLRICSVRTPPPPHPATRRPARENKGNAAQTAPKQRAPAYAPRTDRRARTNIAGVSTASVYYLVARAWGAQCSAAALARLILLLILSVEWGSDLLSPLLF